MEKNAITTAIILFLIVVDVSNASSLWKLRYLADESPTKNNSTTAPPPSSPAPISVSGSGVKKPVTKPDSPVKLDPNLLNKTDSVAPPLADKPPKKEIDSGNNSSLASNSKNGKTMDSNEKKKKNGTETEKGAETKEDKNNYKKTDGDETCVGADNSCEVGNSLTACIKGFGTGSKELVVLVHNNGEKTLKVNVAGPSGESFPRVLKVPKHGTEMLNISLTVSKSSELVLSAGNGNCVLTLNPLVSEGNFFLNLPSYDKLVTPINGAYFLIVAVVIFGGSWACCMFRKRRRHDGIPYQELEMGLPESMPATGVETAEGWDQGWDDDWDEDKAVKSPMGRPVANISANGLTARSSNRDGWENDWDG